MRLLEDMEAEALKIAARGDLYRMSGARDLARLATIAAYATAIAADALHRFHAAEGEEKNRKDEA